MRKLNRQDDPEVQAMLHTAEERILATGRAMGAVPLLGRGPAEMFAAGHRFLVAGTDVAWVREGARRTVAAAQS
jgi:2-keto-3-deoxy-L-rhamnonate aldolase RhmA